MNWRRVFNTTVGQAAAAVPGQAKPIGATPAGAKGVFITPQTLMTFPVATFAVGLLSVVLNALVPSARGNLWVPFVVSLAIGMFIYWVGVTDPKASMTRRHKLIAFGVAVINSAYLFASCTGVLGNLSQVKIG